MADVITFPDPSPGIIFIERAGDRFVNRLWNHPMPLPEVSSDWPNFDLAFRHAMHSATVHGLIVAIKPTRNPEAGQ